MVRVYPTLIMPIEESGYVVPQLSGQGMTNSGILTQNTAYGLVFRVSVPTTVARILWGNAATIHGSIDVGVYRKDGSVWTRLTSNGGAAHSGGSASQSLTFTPVVCLPGFDYALAIASNSATATINRASIGGPVRDAGLSFSLATAYPLPATITPDVAGGTTIPYLVGQPS